MSNLNVKIINLKVKLILHLSHCVIAGVQGSPFKKRLEHRGLEDLDNLKFSSSLHLEPLNYYHCQGRGRTQLLYWSVRLYKFNAGNIHDSNKTGQPMEMVVPV